MVRISIAVLALAAALGASPALAGAADMSAAPRAHAEAVCRDDALRLCRGAIPDEAAIIACMRPKRAALSPSCRKVFDEVVRTVRR